MVLRSFIAFFLLLLITASWSPSPMGGSKKVERTLKATWPEMELKTMSIVNNALLEGEQAYSVHDGAKLIGYYLTAQAKSKFDHFDFMVVFDAEGNILQPKILVYREDYGGEISSKRWLKQFIGMDSDSRMDLRKEIQNISGATISCQSACLGIQSATERIRQIIAEG